MKGPADRGDLLNRLSRSNEVNITVTGRITKRKFSTPVWFVLDAARVLLLPVKGSESNWLKNLTKDPHIELRVEDAGISSKATIVRDSDQVKEVFDKFRAKYRSMWSESYYTKRDVYVEVPV